MPQFFVCSNFINDNQVIIKGEELFHLYKVLRKKPGDIIDIFDEFGQKYIVRIEKIDKKLISCNILEKKKHQKVLPFILYQCLPKARKMDTIIEKGTELGASKVVPIISEFTVIKKVDGNKIERWKRVAHAASKQSGNVLTDVENRVLKFEEIFTNKHDDYLKLIAWELGKVPLKQILKNKKVKGIELIIGPEGGLSKEEVLYSEAKGFKSFRLFGNTLRTETASTVIMSIINYELGFI